MSEQTFPKPTDPVDPPLTLEGLAERVESVAASLRADDNDLANAIDGLVVRVTTIEKRIAERPNADIGGIPQVSTDLMLGPSARKVFQNGNEMIRAYAAEFNAAEVARLKEENEQLRVEVLRLVDIVRTFNQQSVSVS